MKCPIGLLESMKSPKPSLNRDRAGISAFLTKSRIDRLVVLKQGNGELILVKKVNRCLSRQVA
jgi:hypothetical protein